MDHFPDKRNSVNPMACSAALGTLDTYEDEGLLSRATELTSYWEQALHSLKDLQKVVDLRNLGLIAAIELEPRPGEPGARALDVYLDAYKAGLLVRTTGDTIALSPPLIIQNHQIDFIFETLGNILKVVR
ncbi:Aminotransferase-like protein (fragment) [Vibrio nigripulchritudo SFn27]|uniref:aminotransferase class III-fold pyridoxal phosphate-dependent enzyme n=1 Tax=Vibrio nigripulchritudo TaxID=28173 RepID=UPI0003B20167